MRGCRPLTDDEAEAVRQALPHDLQCLFTVAVETGFRIQELLSLRVRDLKPNGQAGEYLVIKRRHTKGKREGKSMLLSTAARAAIEGRFNGEPGNSQAFVREGETPRAGYFRLRRELLRACRRAGLSGKLGWHSLRKLYARRMLKQSGNSVLVVQSALGHHKLHTTTSYLEASQEEVDAAILAGDERRSNDNCGGGGEQ